MNAGGDTLARPVFVLAGPFCHGAHLTAMLGRNPGAYGLPETNLFLQKTLDGLLRDLTGARGSQIHGLIRALAHLLTGEQTVLSVEAARRWLFEHLHWPTHWVFDFLRAKVAPLRLVERVTPTLLEADARERLIARYPDAQFVHITRHPRSHGKAALKDGGAVVTLLGGFDESVTPHVLDPQYLWLRAEYAIETMTGALPEGQVLTIHSEDLLTDPDATLTQICDWLGLPSDAAALERMKHPEASPFAHPGPLGALKGDDADFLANPALPAPDPETRLDGPLPWRPDDAGFSEHVTSRAKKMGYS